MYRFQSLLYWNFLQRKELEFNPALASNFNPFFTGIFCNLMIKVNGKFYYDVFQSLLYWNFLQQAKKVFEEMGLSYFNPFFTGIFCNLASLLISHMLEIYFNPFFTGIFCNPKNDCHTLQRLRISIPSLLEFFATPLFCIFPNLDFRISIPSLLEFFATRATWSGASPSEKISIPSLLEFFATRVKERQLNISQRKFQSLLYWNFLQLESIYQNIWLSI